MEIGIAIGTFALSVLSAAATAFFVVGRYREKVDRLEKDCEKLDNKTTKLRSELDRLDEFKTNAQKFMDSKIYSSGSSLRLTEYGQQLIERSGFLSIFEKVKDDLVTKLEERNPESQYDVQEQARSLMDSLTDYSAFKSIKQYAFESGSDLGQILRAGAILLRDYYFERHPEITE